MSCLFTSHLLKSHLSLIHQEKMFAGITAAAFCFSVESHTFYYEKTFNRSVVIFCAPLNAFYVNP